MKYNLLEEVISPLNEKYNDVYCNHLTIYRDANTGKVINYLEYEGCIYLNTRKIYSNEFVTSEFFTKNYNEIIMVLASIIKKRKLNKTSMLNLNKKSVYKVLNSREFLTSDFAKKHYKEIYNTLDEVIIKKEKVKTKVFK